MNENKRILLSAVGGVLGTLLSVLISLALFVESSPFHRKSIEPDALTLTWMILNLPAFIVGIVAGGGHTPSEAAMAVTMGLQWFLVGFLVSYLIQWRRSRKL